jgi:hypothetical protein
VITQQLSILKLQIAWTIFRFTATERHNCSGQCPTRFLAIDLTESSVRSSLVVLFLASILKEICDHLIMNLVHSHPFARARLIVEGKETELMV